MRDEWRWKRDAPVCGFDLGRGDLSGNTAVSGAEGRWELKRPLSGTNTTGRRSRTFLAYASAYGSLCERQVRIGLSRRASGLARIVRSIRLSPIASIVTDPNLDDNPIIAANHKFEQLTGYLEKELVGRNCRLLAGPETERAQSTALGRAVASVTPTVVELINYRKDGSKFLNAVMIAPVFNDAGDLAYFLGSQMEVAGSSRETTRASALEKVGALTARQHAVLRLMARGLRNRQIGEALGLSEKTIKMHRGAMVRRLGLSSTAEVLRLAIEAGL